MKTINFSSFIVIAIAFLLFPIYQTKAEVLQVPAYGTPTVTSSPLEDGKWYVIEARGTFVYDSYHSRIADAEWAQKNAPEPPDWVENRNHPAFEDIQDLLVNEATHDWMGTTDGVNFASHTYSPSHIYRLEWLGTGEAIAFRIEDAIGSSQYDNIGFLEVEISELPAIEAAVDIDPDTLNLKSEGKFVTVYIELPEDFDASEIDLFSLELNGLIPPLPKPIAIGDYDSDGTNDLMVKFDRQELIALLEPGEQIIDLTGRLWDGRPIAGFDIIRVIH